MKYKILDFLKINIGILLMSVGVYYFKIPNGFVTGGVSGLGTLLGSLTPLASSTWILMMNAAMLVLGFAFLGKGTGLKTVYCSMMYSALVWVFEHFLPVTKPMTDEPLLELVYAVLLTAIGSAIMFNYAASAGGTDIVALIVKKYSRIDVGKCLLISDFIVSVGAFFVFGTRTGLFSLLGLFAKAFLVDSVIESMNSCKYFVIITTKEQDIAEYIMNTMHRGVTFNKARGEYTSGNTAMLHTVCRRVEAVRLRAKIKQIDPQAFIIITTSSEIIGRGFRSV